MYSAFDSLFILHDVLILVGDNDAVGVMVSILLALFFIMVMVILFFNGVAVGVWVS